MTYSTRAPSHEFPGTSQNTAVARQLPKNLEVLYGRLGRDFIDGILPGDTFTVDGVEFVCKYLPESTSKRFFIVKERDLVERYQQLSATTWHGATIVELGIAEGGSTALLGLLAEPTKLIAVEIEPQRLEALDQFIDERGLQASIRPHYGVDQSDHRRLADLVDGERGGQLLDVVIDDASHDYFLTKASFETLFPRLRPGGIYVIEDWNAAHSWRDGMRAAFSNTSAPGYEERRAQLRAAMANKRASKATQPEEVPLSRIAVECLLAAAKGGESAVESATVDKYWVTIVRGPAPLDPEGFHLDDLFQDYFGYLPSLD
jgi:Methyltransferase domain